MTQCTFAAALRRKARHFLFFPAVLIVSSVIAKAGITGSLSGTVKDQSGTVVTNAQLDLTELSTGVTTHSQSDNFGTYSFLALPVGRYRLQATHTGFKNYDQTGIVVNANDVLRIDVILALGPVAESVEVTANAVHAETDSTQVGEVMTSDTIQVLPLNGRSYIDLLALQPSVIPLTSGVLNFNNETFNGTTATGDISIAGQREVFNSFEVNGGSVEEERNNGAAVIPNLDSISEFRVITSNADAEYGNHSGGVINVVTKSGTNYWHGSAFDYLRNQALDGRNFFSPTLEAFRMNQFGGTFGGPIPHGKTFFFADYQGIRETQGIDSGIVTVLSDAQRQGDFSAGAASIFTNTVGGGLASPFFAKTLSQRLGYSVTSGEPYFTSGCTSTSQCVFPNGVIPQAAFSPAAVGLLQFIPPAIPTSAAGPAFVGTSNDQTTDDRFGVRVDSDTRWGMLSAYYFYNRTDLLKPFGDNPVPGFPSEDTGNVQNLNLADTKPFGSNAVNEVHLTITRFVSDSDQPKQGLGTNLRSFGFNVNVPGGLFPANPALQGVPTIQIGGGPAIGEPLLTYDRHETIPQVRDSFTFAHDRHIVKFGGEYQTTEFNQDLSSVASNGFFFFGGTETGSPFADFLLGAPTFFTEETPLDSAQRKNYAGLFGQDNWHARHNLNLNFGLRWEFNQPYYERFNRKITYVLGSQSVVFPTAPQGLLFPGDPLPGGGTVPRGIAATPLNNFAPRLGLAFSPSPRQGFLEHLFGREGTTSIRAGFGIYYSNMEAANTFFSDPAPPYLINYTSPLPPLFESPLTSRTDGAATSLPIPFSRPSPGQNVNFTPFLPLTAVPAMSIHNQTPYSEQYQLDIQRQLAKNTLATIGYIGSQGHHLPAIIPVNPGNPQLCLSAPGCGPGGENGVYTLPNGTVIHGTRGPFGPNFGDDSLISTIANSAYNSMTIGLRHVSTRFNIFAAYTFSKSLDDASSSTTEASINPLNPASSRALSAFDMSQNFVVSYTILLPFDQLGGNGWSRLKHGWRLVGITRFASGLPVTLTETDDRSLLGSSGAGIGNPVDLPNFTPGNLNFQSPESGQPYFSTALFSLEPLGQVGNARRRFFHGPGIDNTDLSLLKDTALSERVVFQLRFEFFDVFNRPQFNNPDGDINDGPANFGLVHSARDPRIGQVAARLSF